MYQNNKKQLKQLATELRKRGLSYSEIKTRVPVPKSTLSFWLSDVKLSREQISKLNRKRIEAAKLGAKKKIKSTQKLIAEIQKSSARDIKKISKRELWLMGIMLYWRERFINNNENDIKRGVKFSSSNPHLIKLFLKWLMDIGRLDKKEIAFDLFIGMNRKNELAKQRRATVYIDYWSKITGFPKNYFKNTYVFKHKISDNKDSHSRVIRNKSKNGLLRIRVKASSMFARQLAGWINGIQNYYWKI